MNPNDSRQFDLHPVDQHRLASLCGQFDENLKHIERRLQVKVGRRGHHFRVEGETDHVAAAVEVIRHLYRETEATDDISPDTVHLFIRETGYERLPEDVPYDGAVTVIKTPKLQAKPRGANQQKYVHSIRSHDINFGIGPAGTGKTYLAMAMAVAALAKKKVSRIILTRPAVEAGEALGFLPGDLAEQINQSLRPLYDALHDMMSFEKASNLMQQDVIEVAPLAFMRGRTLNDSFIILDEAQNSTAEQMKMFLTRIGFNSKAVITGDITQSDLPSNRPSGLVEAKELLHGIDGIKFVFFTRHDVVRHKLVQKIINAYEMADNKRNNQTA